jgi:hypothetical protein
MQPIELTNLKEFWASVFDETPSDAQFVVWADLHSLDTIRRGITKTAIKNLQKGGTMTLDHKVRFASKVMLTKTNDPQKAEGQRLRAPVEKHQ